ncbi:hypothetical protein BDV96DRAFT_613546 [Lophiotrema nucula]|uniref:NACHT domain-containing protein n=1 Tax=Lophiotrema nucula TaxID=690887 RepID=A0A6A5Z3F3_9PLEO|nr:hypothetical protein BDV96DRAFT_613546 [Lophiotrema nucula]
MDPISALGLASNIIQFVQFAGKLISESQEAYESIDGVSQRNANLEGIANDLLNLHQQLLKDASSRTPGAKLSAAEAQLQSLAKESTQVAEKLIGIVQALKSSARNKRWKSVRHAIASSWKQSDIAALQARLGDIRQQLDTALLICLRLTRLLRRQSNTTTLFMHEIKAQQKELLRSIRRYEDRPNEEQLRSLSAQLEASAELDLEGQFCRLMLAQLEFAEIQDRYERICPAHRSTFEWIFRHPDDPLARWDDFPAWLTSPVDDFYWVTGKAGSGKSTLMKHIFDDERTVSYLKEWSQGRLLLTAGFFFWNSGSDIQMSGIGLLRTLLFQILKAAPHLVKDIFNDRWAAYQTLRGGFQAWSWPELKTAFELLGNVGGIRIALFVDGLDEYDGDHEELANFFVRLASKGIKVCVASRPWLVFEDAFDSKPNMLLEHLTRKDIRVFVTDAFNANRHFVRLLGRNPTRGLRLIDEVVRKSSGVFLWVHLVAHSLLHGLANADRTSDLKRRLDELPTDLEELFEKLLRSLEPFYFSHAAQLVQLLKAAPVLPKLLEMSFADEEDAMTAINADIATLAIDEKIERSEQMRRRLNSRCKGLIGISQYSNSNLERVEFLHRTVKDFFDKPRIWAEIMDATPKSFDAYQCWANSLLMELKTCDTDPDVTLPADLFRLIQWAIQHVEHRSLTMRNATFPKTIWTCYLILSSTALLLSLMSWQRGYKLEEVRSIGPVSPTLLPWSRGSQWQWNRRGRTQKETRHSQRELEHHGGATAIYQSE